MEVFKTVEASEGLSGGTEVLEAPSCQHVWMIETPNGPLSRGVCAICAEEKEFQNYIEGSAWGYDISIEQLAGGSRFPTRSAAPDKGLAEDATAD